jgi:hypothetical protein
LNPVHTIPIYFFTTRCNMLFHFTLVLQSDLLLSEIGTNIFYPYSFRTTRATCPAKLWF